MAAPRKYPEEVREAALARYAKGEKIKRIAYFLEVNYWVLVDWLRPLMKERNERIQPSDGPVGGIDSEARGGAKP